MKFAIIGEGVIDRFIDANGFTDVIGGSGLNTAVAAKLAGLNVSWFANTGNDELGQSIRQYATSAGILLPTSQILEFPTSLVEITLGNDGSPAYTFNIQNAVDWQWNNAQLLGLSAFDVFHLTSLSGVLPPGSDAIIRFLQSKPESLITTYDPNARPSALNSKEDMEMSKVRTEEIVSLVDLVKVSEEDLAWITPHEVEHTALRWSESGPQFVVLTRGAAGVSLYHEGREIAYIEGVPTEVVDTVGAGDTVMAWTLRSLEQAKGIPSPEQLVRDLELAVKAAAITCSRQGCKPPTYLEIFES